MNGTPPRAGRIAWPLIALLLIATNLAAADPTTAAGDDAPGRIESVLPRYVPPKPDRSVVPPGHSRLRVHLKFREGTAVRLRGESFVGAPGDVLSGVRAVLARFPGTRIERLFTTPETVLARGLARAEARSDRELADLNLYYRVIVRDGARTEALLDAFNALPIVEIACAEPLPAPPPVTPSFVDQQGYRGAAPGGIGAAFAYTANGARGDRVAVVDLEYSWNTRHEDLDRAGLSGALIANGTPRDPFADDNHGTAVLGVLSGDDDGLGVTGIVPDADLHMVNVNNTERGQDLANSIDIARQNMSPGDVLLLEQQTVGANGGCNAFSQVGCVPVEWVQAYYDAIVAATAAGIIVVEAAGNGSQDLDGQEYGSPFPGGRADSGAIIVGAGGAPGCGIARGRLGFSTFGSRVDLQGWGHCVTTTGYGDLQGGSDPNARGTRGASVAHPARAPSWPALPPPCPAPPSGLRAPT